MGQPLQLSLLHFSCRVENLGPYLLSNLSWFLAPMVSRERSSRTSSWTLFISKEDSLMPEKVQDIWLLPAEESSKDTLFVTPLGSYLTIDRQKREVKAFSVTDDEAGLAITLDVLDVLQSFNSLLPLHCAAFHDEELGRVLVVGPSGAGKSSVLNAFLDAGASFIADDRLLYHYKNDELLLAAFRGFRKTREGEKAERSFLEMELKAIEIEQKLVTEGFTADLLFFPKVVAPAGSQIKTLDSSWQVFRRLLVESYVPARKDKQEPQMQWLKRLSNLPAFEICLGQDERGFGSELVSFCKSELSFTKQSCQVKNYVACLM